MAEHRPPANSARFPAPPVLPLSATVRKVKLHCGGSMSFPTGWALSLCASLGVLVGTTAQLRHDSQEATKRTPAAVTKPGDVPARNVAQRIDLTKALKVSLPSPARDLEATSFTTGAGKGGWVLRIPGARPIATPAYADGMLCAGGGYGSHEFYAVDSDTGKVIWKIGR